MLYKHWLPLSFLRLGTVDMATSLYSIYYFESQLVQIYLLLAFRLILLRCFTYANVSLSLPQRDHQWVYHRVHYITTKKNNRKLKNEELKV